MEGLLTQNFIQLGDGIEFVFKKFKIHGKVGHGGHITHTIIVTPQQEILQNLQHRVYPSLTAWSEACLREGLHEENMRYASWKRVIHQESGRTLQSLRSEYNVSVKTSHASRQDLYAEINRLHLKVKQMTRVVPVYTPTPCVRTDRLLKDSDAIAFFKEWNGSCLANTCLPQTGAISD